MRFNQITKIIKQEIGPDAGRKVAEAICREASGTSVYIPSRAEKPVLRPTDTVKDLQRRYAIAKSTAYNWVHQWRK